MWFYQRGPYKLELICDPIGSRATEILTFFVFETAKNECCKNENPQELQNKP